MCIAIISRGKVIRGDIKQFLSEVTKVSLSNDFHSRTLFSGCAH